MIGRALGHYRIDALLGAGGEGIVYRAFDTDLQRSVALKVLTGTPDQTNRARVLREARAASALNHPNICTIYEVDEAAEQSFIVMEHVEGRPLRNLIPRGGLPVDAVLHYGMQIADALAHAHEHGVTHRDLKTSNVIVASDGRAKVLDFGLARRLPVEELDAVTRSRTAFDEAGAMAGTLPYMAPEVLRGHPADMRSDVWSFGVLLYEMTTGVQPFNGGTAYELTAAILGEPPRPLGAPVAGLRVPIYRCLAKDPGQRYQRASDVRAVLEALRPEIRRRTRMKTTAIVAGVILGIVIALAFGYRQRSSIERARTGRPPAAAIPAVAPARRSVAVLGFTNLSGRPETGWLSLALSEMLTTELAAGERLRTVSGEDVARMKIDLALRDADSYASDTLAKMRQILGAEYVVLGSYLDLGKEAGGQVRVDVRLQDAAAGETIASVSQTGAETRLLDLVSTTGAELRRRLGVGEVTAAQVAEVRASLPSIPEAARLYLEGIAKLRVFDALVARDLLEKAVAAEPAFALSHVALAEAWSRLGYDERAQAEAKKAVDLSANLSRADRYSIEGRYREMTKQHDEAIEAYATLFRFFPDDLDYGLRLMEAQISAGKGKDALATAEALRKLPERDDPRIDLAEAAANELLSEFKREVGGGATAARKGSAQGQRLVAAEGRLREGFGYWKLAAPKQAMSALDDAKRMYDAGGDRFGVARTLLLIGNVVYDQGDFARAKSAYRQVLTTARQIGNKKAMARATANLGNVLEKQGDIAGSWTMKTDALEIQREINDRPGVAASLNNLANLLWRRSDFVGSLKMYKEALAIRQEIGDRIGAAGTLNNIAGVLVYQGELAAARKAYSESLEMKRAISDRNGLIVSLSNLAEVLLYEGDLANAEKNYIEILQTAREVGNKSVMGYALFGLGDVLLAKGDLSGAKTNHEKALALRRELGEKGSAAESGVALAGVALEDSRPTEAETLARQAAEEFQKEKESDDEILAQAVLARAFLAEGQVGEASKTAGLLQRLAATSQNRAYRLVAALAVAQVLAASTKASDVGRARRSLSASLAEASRFGFVGYQLEAGLALGETDMTSGNAEAGRVRLAALERDAARKGFHLIARKAARAAR